MERAPLSPVFLATSMTKKTQKMQTKNLGNDGEMKIIGYQYTFIDGSIVRFHVLNV